MSDVVNATVPGEESQQPVPRYYVHLTILAAETNEAVAFATIKYGIGRGTFSSDEWGRALITDTSPGRRKLSVTADGYEPLIGYLVMKEYGSNITLYMSKKAVDDAGAPPPQVDIFPLSMFVLTVLITEVAFILIVYTRLKRKVKRSASMRKRSKRPVAPGIGP
jgi:hypothetical protein